MAVIRPFAGIRPCREKAARIAALPYDVYNRQEAKADVEREPESFLKIDRAETQFDDSVDTYAPEVYQRAHDTLWEMVEKGDFIRDERPCYYIYELTMDGRTQTGIVACASIDDYENGVIKKHENTRAEKEKDRICHVDACDAQTGPIFLAYRADEAIRAVVTEQKKAEPEYDFISPDGVAHRVWVIRGEEAVRSIQEAFAGIGSIYIADGHHRAASAVRVGQKRRAEHPDYDGSEEFNYFLSVLFPDEELHIMDYNRVVKDLNGLTAGELLKKMREIFEVSELSGGEKDPGKREPLPCFWRIAGTFAGSAKRIRRKIRSRGWTFPCCRNCCWIRFWGSKIRKPMAGLISWAGSAEPVSWSGAAIRMQRRLLPCIPHPSGNCLQWRMPVF